MSQTPEIHNYWSAAHTTEQTVKDFLTRFPPCIELAMVENHEQAKRQNQLHYMKRDGTNTPTNSSSMPQNPVVQPTKWQSSNTARYVVWKFRSAMDQLSTRAQRRHVKKVVRWLDTLPESFPRVPEISQSDRELMTQLVREKLEEGYRSVEMGSTPPHPQQQLRDEETSPVTNNEARESITQIGLQRQHSHMVVQMGKAKAMKSTGDVDKHQYLQPAEQLTRPITKPLRREDLERYGLYFSQSDTSPHSGPPPIPSRPPLKICATVYPEASPGNVQYTEPYAANCFPVFVGDKATESCKRPAQQMTLLRLGASLTDNTALEVDGR